jgi:hypothetical protein
MKTKQTITLFILLSVLLFTACGNSGSSVSNNGHPTDTAGLKEMSGTVIEKMQTINRDENYHSLLSTSEELSRILKEWTECQPDPSADILVIPVTEKLIRSYSRNSLDKVSGVSKDFAIRRIASNLAGYISSRFAGTSAIAASSIAGYSETFRMDTDKLDNQVWIIPCTDSVGIIVNFINTGDRVATISAAYCTLPEPEKREELLSLLFGASDYKEMGAYYLPS